ncbi:hypothetical protein [Streptomyces sp. NPDC000851]
MRKYQKVAVVAAMLGSVSFLGAGVGHANEDPKVKIGNEQVQKCSGNEVNVTGSSAADVDDVITNGAGLQVIDQSEHKSVNCSHIFVIGKK